MVALNLANEFLQGDATARPSSTAVWDSRVRALRERVEGALEKGQQLEL